MRSNYSVEEKKKYVREQQSSGLKVSDWCRQNNIRPTTFRGWVLKYSNHENNNNNNNGWAKVSVANTSQNSSPILLKAGAFSLEIDENFDERALSKLIKVIAEHVQ